MSNPHVMTRDAHADVRHLSATWRAAACQLRRYMALSYAQVLEICADELDAAIRSGADAVLTPTQASAESGYSSDHLEAAIGATGFEPVTRALERPRK